MERGDHGNKLSASREESLLCCRYKYGVGASLRLPPHSGEQDSEIPVLTTLLPDTYSNSEGSESRKYPVLQANTHVRCCHTGLSAYCSSKAGLTHLTRVLALEWARHGIRVNAVCPGYFRTEMNSDFFNTPSVSEARPIGKRRPTYPVPGTTRY